MTDDSPIEQQQQFWNSWISQYRETRQNFRSQRQAEVVLKWIASLGRTDLDLLDVGCGSGWLAEQLMPYGHVTATDLADSVLERARRRVPRVDFIAGDFLQLALPPRAFDVVVSLEVLSHVADQPQFIRKIASLLRPGGHIILGTQNAFVLKRMDVDPLAPGQLRHWVTARELRALANPLFEITALRSIVPDGHRGILRLVNSPRLNAWMSRMVAQSTLDGWKEDAMLGHTLMLLGRVRNT